MPRNKEEEQATSAAAARSRRAAAMAEAKRRVRITQDMPGWNHIVCADGLSYDYNFEPQSQSSMVEEF
jgi:hypothetical protein